MEKTLEQENLRIKKTLEQENPKWKAPIIENLGCKTLEWANPRIDNPQNGQTLELVNPRMEKILVQRTPTMFDKMVHG